MIKPKSSGLLFFLMIIILVFLFLGNIGSTQEKSEIIGFDYWVRGFYQEAFQQWSDFIKENPDSPDAELYWIMIEEIISKLGKYDDLIELAQAIISSNSNNQILKAYAKFQIVQAYIKRGEISRAEQEAKNLGMVTDWLLIGPFDNTGKSGFKKIYPPEEEIDVQKSYIGKDSIQLNWFKPGNISFTGFVNLDFLLYPNDWSVGYALTYVYSPEEKEVLFKVGADEALKVWLNDQVIIEKETYRGVTIDQEFTLVYLKQGWNKVLVKVCEKEGSWGFYFRITDLEGNPLRNLIYSTEVQKVNPAFEDSISPEESQAEQFNLGDALSHYQKEWSKNPVDIKALLFSGLIFQKRGLLEESIKQFETAISIDSENALAHYLLGNAYQQEEKFDEAIEEIKRSLQIDPQFIQANIKLGLNYYEKGLYKEAITEFEKALEVNADFVDAHLFLSWTYERKGWNLEARNKLEEITQDNPLFVLAQYNLGMAYERKGWLERAIQQYIKVLNLDYDHYSSRMRLGSLYSQLGRYPEAINLYREVLSWRPEDSSLYLNIADTYRRMEENERAIEVLQEASKLFPYNSSIYAQLGYLYHERGEDEEAINFWRKALEISPEFIGLRDYIDFIVQEEGSEGINVRELIANSPSAEEYPEASAAILLNETRREVNQDGTSSTTYHQVIKIFNKRGIEKYGEVFITYNAWGERITIKKARTYKVDGSVVEATSIKDIFPLEGYRLYSNVSQKVISMPALEEGVTIEYQYTLDDYSRSFVGKNFQDIFYLQDLEPIQICRYILTIPKEVKLKIANFKTELQPKIREGGDKVIYTWEVTQIPQLIYEDDMPPFHNIAPHIAVSSFSSWEEIATWYDDISREQSKANADIKAKVAELIQNEDTTEGKIKAIYHYVINEIRYLGLEFGISGHMPHEAAEIYKYKYGDCKDKATLLISMLREAGIEAYYVLLRTRYNGELDLNLPSFQFDHAIAAVKLNGKLVFLDGTAENYGFGDLPAMDQGVWAMVLMNGKGEFKQIPIYPAEKNQRARKIKLYLQADGSLKGEASLLQTGLFAAYYRSLFRDLGEIKRKELIQNSLSSSCPGSVLEEFSFSDLTNLNLPVEQRYKFRVPNYAKKIGNKLSFKPSVMERIESTSLVATEERRFPMYFYYLYCTQNIIEIIIPEGFKVEMIPEEVNLVFPFGIYRAKYTVEEEKIIYQRDYYFNSFEISKEEYPGFREFIERIAIEDAKEIVLTQE
ncbi:MAG: DUF3857 domain-containing protein [Candidatus Caldatribacteriota bacterium]